MAIPDFCVLLKAEESTMDENLGFADPMGSRVVK